MGIQSKEKASGTNPEAKEDNPVDASIVSHKAVDSIDEAVSAEVDPCGFAAVVERIGGMQWDEFKSTSKPLAKELSEGSGVDADKMLKVIKSVRGAMNGEERHKGTWEVDPKPWPEDVDLLSTIREVENIIRRIIVCDERYVTAAAYFIVATWFVDSVHYAPYAVITAPARRCGKSMMMDLMARLVRRPFVLSGKPSEATIFRTIDEFSPTLMLDEVDTYLKNSEELQGILNGGISRDMAYVPRCEKTASGNFVTRTFKTFGFKIMSGIGADRCGSALVDRAIVIRLSRKTSGDKREKARRIPKDQWEALRSKMMRLSLKHAEDVERLSASGVDLPESLGDRDCDKWEVLFIIADLCGKDEGRRVRNVACEIAGEEAEETWQTELLSDATEIAVKAMISPGGLQLDFGNNVGMLHVGITDGGKYGDCIMTATLHQALTLNPDGQWREFGRSGKPIPQHLMTKTIKEFGVISPKLKNGRGCTGFPVKGRGSLTEANERYGRRERKDGNADK